MIRAATEADIDALIRIEECSFGPDLRWDAEEFIYHLSRIIVWEAEAIVPWLAGYATMKVRDGLGIVQSVAVLPTARGNGVGAALTREAVKRMAQAGAGCIELECNLDLVDFYRKFGFEVCGFYTTGVGPKQKARVCMRVVVK